jgi:hypothetical protein
MSNLRQFWFRFEKPPTPTPINLDCGVTAFSKEDALQLLRERVFGAEDVPPLAQVIEDVRPEALERKHVVPNLGKIEQRGIWFPQGYDGPK